MIPSGSGSVVTTASCASAHSSGKRTPTTTGACAPDLRRRNMPSLEQAEINVRITADVKGLVHGLAKTLDIMEKLTLVNEHFFLRHDDRLRKLEAQAQPGFAYRRDAY